MLLQETEKSLAKNPDNKYYQARLRDLREKVRGDRYRGRRAIEFDKESVYRVSSEKYWHYYIGHYDSKKYQEQLKDYKSGKRKSRPNGRRWCKLPNGFRIIKRKTLSDSKRNRWVNEVNYQNIQQRLRYA